MLGIMISISSIDNKENMMMHRLYPAVAVRPTRVPRRETEYELFMRLADERRSARRRQRRHRTLRAIRTAGRPGR